MKRLSVAEWLVKMSDPQTLHESATQVRIAQQEAYSKTKKGAKEAAAKKDKRRISRAPLVLFHANKRRAGKIQRTPPWADLDAMRAIYDEAARLTRETGKPYHVDHVVPLQGKKVSGLHVPANLQILPASENIRKRNHFEVEV